MLFARWQHHLRFCSGFPYAPLKAMVTKISKWSRIQDSCRITPKIESLVVCAIPGIPSKFQKDPPITLWVILLTHKQTDRQTDRQTKSGKNITSLAEVIISLYSSIVRSQTLQHTMLRRPIVNRLGLHIAPATSLVTPTTAAAIEIWDRECLITCV